MEKSKLEVKNNKIKEIFYTMEYGNVRENIDLAKTWLLNDFNPKQLQLKSNDTTYETHVIKNVLNNQELTKVYLPTKLEILNKSETGVPLEFGSYKRDILKLKLVDEIEKNVDVICQLEMCIRGFMPKDTKTSIKVLTENLKFEHFYKMENDAIVRFAKESSLIMFGHFFGLALSNNFKSITIYTDLQFYIIAHFFLNLATKIGFKDVPFVLVPTENLLCDEPSLLLSFNNNLSINAINAKGKIPMIVFNSADLDSACEAAVQSTWGNQGNVPWAVNTVLIQEDIFEEFVDKLKTRLQNVRMGDADDKSVDFSYPVLNDNFKEKLDKKIKTATTKGIEVFQLNSEKFSPTMFIGARVNGNNVIIDDQNDDIPNMTLLAFRNVNEVAALANNSRQVLAASVWTENIGVSTEISRKLQVNTVWINTHGQFNPNYNLTSRKRICQADINKYTVMNPKLHLIIEAARKAQNAWSKLSTLARAEKLKQIACNIENNKTNLSSKAKDDTIKNWVSSLFHYSAYYFNSNNSNIHEKFLVVSCREPVGLVFYDDDNISQSFVSAIICTITQGNSIIVKPHESTSETFLMEIAKLFPTGLLNIIKQDVEMKHLKAENIDVFIKSSEFSYVEDHVTNCKHIWYPVGDSFA